MFVLFKILSAGAPDFKNLLSFITYNCAAYYIKKYNQRNVSDGSSIKTSISRCIENDSATETGSNERKKEYIFTYF